MPFSFIGRFFDKSKIFFPYEYKDYSFKIDLQYGDLYFTRKLISFSGKHLPLNLSLNYSQMHVNAWVILGQLMYAWTLMTQGIMLGY